MLLCEGVAELTSDCPIAYGNLYSLCSLNNVACSGSAGASPTSIKATIRSATGAPAPSITSSSLGPLPTIAGLGSVVPACSSMLGMYLSCSRNLPGFEDQPFGQQAPCYW